MAIHNQQKGSGYLVQGKDLDEIFEPLCDGDSVSVVTNLRARDDGSDLNTRYKNIADCNYKKARATGIKIKKEGILYDLNEFFCPQGCDEPVFYECAPELPPEKEPENVEFPIEEIKRRAREKYDKPKPLEPCPETIHVGGLEGYARPTTTPPPTTKQPTTKPTTKPTTGSTTKPPIPANCFVHLSDILVSDSKSFRTISGTSYQITEIIGEPSEYADIFRSAGEFPDFTIDAPNSSSGSLDGIAVDAGTKLIFYYGKNFTEGIAFTLVGPAILTSDRVRDNYESYIDHTFDEPFQTSYPQERRFWTPFDIGNEIANGSFKIECGAAEEFGPAAVIYGNDATTGGTTGGTTNPPSGFDMNICSDYTPKQTIAEAASYAEQEFGIIPVGWETDGTLEWANHINEAWCVLLRNYPSLQQLINNSSLPMVCAFINEPPDAQGNYTFGSFRMPDFSSDNPFMAILYNRYKTEAQTTIQIQNLAASGFCASDNKYFLTVHEFGHFCHFNNVPSVNDWMAMTSGYGQNPPGPHGNFDTIANGSTIHATIEAELSDYAAFYYPIEFAAEYFCSLVLRHKMHGAAYDDPLLASEYDKYWGYRPPELGT